jgi:peptidoglycan/LPS O-acetylase OafA/YrhL
MAILTTRTQAPNAMDSTNSGEEERLRFLDSIRGIAAFMVLCGHINYTIMSSTSWLEAAPFRFLKAFVFAVIVFFLLSGFVLALQVSHKQIGYANFIVRRTFRLFPAFIFSVTASYLIYVLWRPEPMPSLGAWFNEVSWPRGITFQSYLGQLSLNGSTPLLSQAWSLVIEWHVSLVFPLLAMAFKKSPKLVLLISLAVAWYLSGEGAWLASPSSGSIRPFAEAAFYGWFFVAGMALFYWRADVIYWLERLPLLRLALFGYCIYFLCFRAQTSGYPASLHCGFVAAMLVAVAMADRKVQTFLELAPFQYLGRISYSLYLIHMIWIGLLFRMFSGLEPLFIALCVVFFSILSADLMNRWIEIPAIRLGRTIANRLR